MSAKCIVVLISSNGKYLIVISEITGDTESVWTIMKISGYVILIIY